MLTDTVLHERTVTVKVRSQKFLYARMVTVNTERYYDVLKNMWEDFGKKKAEERH